MSLLYVYHVMCHMTPGVAPPPVYPGPEGDMKSSYQPGLPGQPPPPVGFNVGVDPAYPPPPQVYTLIVYIICMFMYTI